MESAMASSKRVLNARSQARNARGQFASVKMEVGAAAAPKQIILVYSSSDFEGAPAPTEKVGTSAAVGEKRMASSVATRTRAIAAGKKSASGAPPLNGKRGSASVNKATSASKNKLAPAKKGIAGGAAVSKQKKASLKKGIAMGASGSKQKNKLQVFVEEEFSEEDMSDVSSYTWVTDNSCDNSCDCLWDHRPAHMDGLQWALKRAKNEAMACVDANAATYSREAKKDINGIFVDLYDEIKAKYKPKK